MLITTFAATVSYKAEHHEWTIRGTDGSASFHTDIQDVADMLTYLCNAGCIVNPIRKGMKGASFLEKSGF